MIKLGTYTISGLEYLRTRQLDLRKRVKVPELREVVDKQIKAIDKQLGRMIEARANVIDKVEHGHDFKAMCKSFAATAQCSSEALERSVYEKISKEL